MQYYLNCFWKSQNNFSLNKFLSKSFLLLRNNEKTAHTQRTLPEVAICKWAMGGEMDTESQMLLPIVGPAWWGSGAVGAVTNAVMSLQGKRGTDVTSRRKNQKLYGVFSFSCQLLECGQARATRDNPNWQAYSISYFISELLTLSPSLCKSSARSLQSSWHNLYCSPALISLNVLDAQIKNSIIFHLGEFQHYWPQTSQGNFFYYTMCYNQNIKSYVG